MALIIDYIPYGTSSSQLMTQANYLTNAAGGAVVGVADVTFANKAWRQSSMMTAALANLIANNLQINLLDDGVISSLISNLNDALNVKPARIVTSSTNFSLTAHDFAVGLNRTSSPAATQVTLMPGVLGQRARIFDVANNAGTFNITVVPNTGTIGGVSTYVINTNRGSAEFQLLQLSPALWGVISG